jgi:hypothetical protein
MATAAATSTTSRRSRDVAYLLFGQAMPGLDRDDQMEVVIALYDGDFDVAFTILTRAIADQAIPVDRDILAYARAHAS